VSFFPHVIMSIIGEKKRKKEKAKHIYKHNKKTRKGYIY
jgi:hypothetical protein